MLRNRAVWLFLVTCLLSVLACGGANEATPVPPTSPPPTAERSGGERGEGVSTATVVAAPGHRRQLGLQIGDWWR